MWKRLIGAVVDELAKQLREYVESASVKELRERVSTVEAELRLRTAADELADRANQVMASIERAEARGLERARQNAEAMKGTEDDDEPR